MALKDGIHAPDGTHKVKFLVLAILALSVASFHLGYQHLTEAHQQSSSVLGPKCDNPASVQPPSYKNGNGNGTVEVITYDPEYRVQAVEKLLGSVRIPTESFDTHLDPSEYPEQYKNFTRLHEYFRKTYPEVYKVLKVEKTKYEYSMVYIWEGSEPSLKPLVLAGHQDVVPVNAETLDQWEYPPYDGVYDGTNVYGRGVSDCKSVVNSVLESIELLIKEGVTPKRTLVLAFGFDEEVGGGYGAQTINEFLLEKFGPDGIYAIVDEGGNAVEKLDDTYFALPAVGEKGSINSVIQLNTKGGHSSAPPENTGIGIMADLIHTIESEPFEPYIDVSNPFLKYLYCMVEHTTKDDIGLPRDDIAKFEHNKDANKNVVEWVNGNTKFKWLAKTTQAADIFHSGIKVNALPELSTLFINHRINIGSTCQQTQDKIKKQVTAIAQKYGLGLTIKDEVIIQDNAGIGSFVYDTTECLEPAPITPTTGNPVWDTFAGTVRHILEDITYPGAKVVVAPSITTGNTDTAKYWNLTKNIFRYRFSIQNAVLEGHIHGVNETMPADSYLNMIAFYYEYIQNACQ